MFLSDTVQKGFGFMNSFFIAAEVVIGEVIQWI